jgi:hypothetical protein
MMATEPRRTDPQPDTQPVRTWHCVNCQLAIAAVHGPHALRVGNLVFRRKVVSGECVQCGHRFKLAPAAAGG